MILVLFTLETMEGSNKVITCPSKKFNWHRKEIIQMRITLPYNDYCVNIKVIANVWLLNKSWGGVEERNNGQELIAETDSWTFLAPKSKLTKEINLSQKVNTPGKFYDPAKLLHIFSNYLNFCRYLES